MKKLFYRALAVSLGLGLMVLPLSAATTTTWGGWDQVTYASSVSDVSIGTQSAAIYIKQFSADAVAEHWGNTYPSSSYTLSKVIVTINGSVAGYFDFINNSEFSKTVNYAALSGDGFVFSAAGFKAAETFTDKIAPPTITVAATSHERRDFSSAGNGSSSTTFDVGTKNLSAFIGNGDISSYVTLYLSKTVTDSGLSSTLFSATGSASISITYEYVPEPTSLALLGLGCAALALRRRRVARV